MGCARIVAFGVAVLCSGAFAYRISELSTSVNTSTALLLAEGEPCSPPLVGDLSFFLKQCMGRCSQATPSLVYRHGVAELSFYRCQAPAPKLGAADIWTQSSYLPAPKRQLAFEDSRLWEAMSLSFQVSEFEVVSDERQKLMDHSDTMEEMRAHMGVGTVRSFMSHMTEEAATRFAARSLRGEHASNEDALLWLETTRIAALAMLDGHGGSRVSDYASHAVLRAMPTLWLQQLQSGQDKSQFASFWSSALKAHFADLQATLWEQNIEGGSTASVVVTDKNTGATVVAWLGDSRVMHARPREDDSWELRWISHEHVCTLDQSWNESCGTNEDVVCQKKEGSKPRACNGRSCVGVTRALGDKPLFDLGLLVGSPEIHELNIQSDDVLLVASDGVWDMLHVDAVLNALQQGVHDAAHYLTVKARALWAAHGHAPDDISVVLWHAQIEDPPAWDPFLARWRPGFPKYHLHASSPQWLAKGGVGDWCQQLSSVSSPSLTGALKNLFSPSSARSSKPESTCGFTEAVNFDRFGQLPKLQQVGLQCFSRDSVHGRHPAVGGYGVCAIPKWMPCGRLSLNPYYGCRPGTLCVASRVDNFDTKYICESA
eukprot:TRINITY_DN87619_c0_g1_i1.p1 TRINITY_DN87619_c0_g1~~TRINITY_DN87619_c0_g1_i1.p1  ORF type:complete len:600 (-),score=94.47 TRINITY_DN87619_c0_g1_i1:73-1872(-)